MEQRVSKINLANSKVGKLSIELEEKYLSIFREAASTERNKPLTRDVVQQFLVDYDKLDTEVHSLLMNHSLFYNSAILMKGYMDDFGLEEITGKVFPKQLEALKALLSLVKTLGSYYKNEADNKK